MKDRPPRPRKEILDRIRPEQVERQEGTPVDFLERHLEEARLVIQAGRPGLEKVAPHLLGRIADERTLRAAWHHLERSGLQAPGPDGLGYQRAEESEKWEACRSVGRRIRAGEYRPGPERVVRVSWGPGGGERPAPLQGILDRVVQRAAVFVLEPLLYPRLVDPPSGYHPGKSRLHALALAENLFLREGRRAWVTAAVEDSLAHVPLPRVVRLVRRYFRADDLADLVGHVLSGSSAPGLRPTGALSELLVNLYLHHLVDRPWQERHPGLPLLRAGSELLAPCRSAREARGARATLSDLLAGAGMPPRGGKVGAARPVTPEAPAAWLGLLIDCPNRTLRYRVADGAWGRLTALLCLAREDPDAARGAALAVERWLSWLGPCCPWENNKTCAAYDRVKAVAREVGLDGIPGKRRFRTLLDRAGTRWDEARRMLPWRRGE